MSLEHFLRERAEPLSADSICEDHRSAHLLVSALLINPFPHRTLRAQLLERLRILLETRREIGSRRLTQPAEECARRLDLGVDAGRRLATQR